MWRSKTKRQSRSLSPKEVEVEVEVDYLRPCEDILQSIKGAVKRGKLLNNRQCLDLSSKLSTTIWNIRQLLERSKYSTICIKYALQNLCRYLEKAKLLVNQCGEEDWCVASIFQGQNANSFQEILLDVALCYNAIIEQVEEPLVEDLRQSSTFFPILSWDIIKDQRDLQIRLEGLTSEPSNVKWFGYFFRERVRLKQCLARYLLKKFNNTSLDFLANTSDMCDEILWKKESEPRGTWGNSKSLGAGSGASGVCSTQWLGVPCAKKEFHGSLSEKLYLKEAVILAHLNHPCIVNFICCGNGKEKGDRFIAMELMEMSLSDLIEKKKNAHFSLPVVVDIIVQIARGMHYLHDQGVAHRDLKPQNVVVTSISCARGEEVHYCVKLVDFGVSKIKVEVSKSDTISNRGVGTTRYRAPEIHPKANPDGKGKARWFKADVYSFAMTCVHLLSLKLPFKDMENFNELYSEIMKGQRPELPSECPEELVGLLNNCWDTNPHSRPSSLEICTRLETIRFKILGGYLFGSGINTMVLSSTSYEFIKLKLGKQSFNLSQSKEEQWLAN